MTLSPYGDDEVGAGSAAQGSAASPYGDDEVGGKPTMRQRAGDMFTGNLRETPEMDRTPELPESGLLSGESKAKSALVATALSTTTNPDELAKIITKQFPHIQIQYNKDAQGNVYPLLHNPKNNVTTMVNKPGWTISDTAQAIGIGSLFLNAAPTQVAKLGMKTGAKALASGAESAIKTLGIGGAIETGQAATGGEFNPMTPVVDALLTGPLEAVPVLFRGRAARLRDEAQTLASEAEDARVGEITQPLSAQSQNEALNTTTQQVAEAAQGGATDQQLRQVAGDVQPDPEILAAARELGVEPHLLPAHFSTNPSYVEMEMGLSVIPGSHLSRQHKEAVTKVAEQADKLIVDLGGTTDKLGLSNELKDNILGTIDGLDSAAEGLYTQLNALDPARPVDVTAVRNALERQAMELGGESNLDGAAKVLYNMSEAGQVTYAMLDRQRKRVGAALRKKTGPYKDMESGELKYLYRILSEAQEQALEADPHAAEMWKQAKALTAKRKALEDDSVVLMGKDFANAIMPKVGRALTQLAKGEYAGFKRVIDKLPPDQQQQVVLSALNDVFTTGSRAEKQLSIPGFVDWYEAVQRSPDAMRMLTDYLPPGAMDRLKTLFTVSRGIRNATKGRIQTGVIQGLLKQFSPESLARAYGPQVARTAAGEVIGAIGGVPGAATAVSAAGNLFARNADEPIVQAADAMLSSPQFQTMARELARAEGATSAATGAAERALEKSRAYQKWLDALPPEMAATVSRLGMLAWLDSDQ